MKKQEKGITLVALVITIIILLILAGITISSLTYSGLFEKTKLAKEKYKNSELEENEIMQDYQNKIDTYNKPTVSSNRGSGEKELLFSSEEGWNDMENPITLSKSWKEYEELVIIATNSNSTKDWSEYRVSKELLTILEGKENNLFFPGFGSYYITVSVENDCNFKLIDATSGADRIYYIYGIK